METLLTPLDNIGNYKKVEEKFDPLKTFIDYINVLEGYKTKIKNLHWASKKLVNYYTDPIHKRLDTFLDIVIEFQDSVAEKAMGIHGDIEVNAIKGIDILESDPLLLLENLLSTTEVFYYTLTGCTYSGIKSETELFIANINNQKYLFNLCKK